MSTFHYGLPSSHVKAHTDNESRPEHMANVLQAKPPDRLLPILATYLGHTHVSITYWYLSSLK
jgi:hypothetical protein